MKSCYADLKTRAIADLVRPGELTRHWTITRINVPKQHRGQGHGTELLQRIIDDADTTGVSLQLEVSASDGLDDTELRAWYRRHGFRAHYTGYLIRRPDTIRGDQLRKSADQRS